MRVIITTILLAALGYTGYWHLAARTIDSQTRDFLDQSSIIRVQDYALGGFPYRFHMRLEAPEILGRRGLVLWHTPELDLHALSYKPHHVIAVFPALQHFRIAGKDATLQSADTRASIVSRAHEGMLDLQRGNAVLEAPVLTIAGMRHQADSLRAALRHVAGSNYDFAIEMHAARLDDSLRQQIDPQGAFPDLIAQAALRADVEFAHPLSLTAHNNTLQETRIDEITLTWGDLQISGSGQLALDQAGRLDGNIALQVTEWQQILQLMAQTGDFAPDAVQMMQMMLATLSDPESGILNLDLQVQDSIVSVGPLVLGQLPGF